MKKKKEEKHDLIIPRLPQDAIDRLGKGGSIPPGKNYGSRSNKKIRLKNRLKKEYPEYF